MRNHSHVFQRMTILTAATVTYFSRDLPLLLINFSRPVFISGSHCYKKISFMNSKTKDIFPKTGYSLRKPPTFGDATTGFPAKWRLRNERTNSIPMTRHQPDLGSDSSLVWNLFVSQTSFVGLDEFCRKNKRILRRAFCWQNKTFSSRIRKISGSNDILNT